MNLETIEKLHVFANLHNMKLPQLCLAWLLAKDVIPLFGTTKKVHLEENLKALSLNLSQQVLEELDELLVSIKISGARIPKSAQNLYLDF